VLREFGPTGEEVFYFLGPTFCTGVTVKVTAFEVPIALAKETFSHARWHQRIPLAPLAGQNSFPGHSHARVNILGSPECLPVKQCYANATSE
jgi:hypothetical protein